MESALPAAGLLYWVGAGTAAYLALRVSYTLFTAFRVWGVGNEAGVGPGLGEWAGESDAAPPPPLPWLGPPRPALSSSGRSVAFPSPAPLFLLRTTLAPLAGCWLA
ncbi:Estradiol 17-beta-dehydrogenase 12 [Tupaia chinensis]|uniref:Estradiol 17-beta-dehydrogenase 12 n=1 Tax=Tupaia chinensis TaxID=246437 RepID=L9JBW3_TUPCH|nr:Estradiol 17-beta-dehydrogenase 12 [Tupaia chinensis]